MSQHKLGSMPVALRTLPGVGRCMALGERLELLSTSAGTSWLRQQPLNVPPALHATPLRLADGNSGEPRRAQRHESWSVHALWSTRHYCVDEAPQRDIRA